MNTVGGSGTRTKLVLKALAFVFLVSIGLAIRGWALLQWETNFDSDEAVFGLMALHITEGEYVPTVYGTRHLGSIESYLAAFLIEAIGFHVVTFRAASYLLLGGFFLAHARYVYKTWGSVAAMVSLGFAAIPGFHILAWTYQPIGAYAALLLIGTVILILFQGRIAGGTAALAGYPLLGLLMGLGLWANQMILAYILAAVLPTVLSSSEWARLRQRLSQFIFSRLRLEPLEVFPTVALSMAAVGVVAFFSSGCSPTWQFERLASIARILLATAMGLVVLGLFIVSDRRNLIAKRLGLGLVGFAAGFFPLWYGWVTGYQKPVSVIRASCPTGTISRLQLLVEEILPEFFGVRAFRILRTLDFLQQTVSLIILALSVIALVWFIWRTRQWMWSLLSLRPTAVSEGNRSITLGLLAFIPILLAVVGGNTVDIHSIRYLLVSWQAVTIILGVFATQLRHVPAALRLAVVVVWGAFIGISNIAYAGTQWPAKFTRFDQAAIVELEAYLQDQRAVDGFADYWGAYSLDFLTEERLGVAPYNGLDRIPAYTEKAKVAKRVAFIFPASRRPGAGKGIAQLRDFLGTENPISGEGPAFGQVIDSLDGYEVESRRAVAYWDVWIMVAK